MVAIVTLIEDGSMLLHSSLWVNLLAVNDEGIS
jgi:hypothetical protein